MTTIKDSIAKTKFHAAMTRLCLTAASLLVVCAGASAQNKKQKKDKESPKTELKVGYSNLSALEIQKDKAVFYNDLMTTADASIKTKNGFEADAHACVLNIYSNNNWNSINNKMLLEAKKHFGKDAEIGVQVGRSPIQAADVFFNGVAKMDYKTDSKGFATFGDPQQGAFFYVKNKKGSLLLGCSNRSGEGWYFAPNLKDPDVRAFLMKVNKDFEKDGLRISLSATGRVGEKTKQGFANVAVTNGKVGVAAGGNYDWNSEISNTYLRGSYKDIENGWTYVAQAIKEDKTLSAQIGVGKNGFQVYTAVENMNITSQKAPEFTSTPTVNVGVSYTFGGGRNIQ